MLLNETNSLTKIKQLLDDPSVYKYVDVSHDETDENGNVTTVIDTSAIEQMESDILIIADEVYINEMLPVISSSQYNTIKLKSFDNYTVNDKRLFFAECYFIASKFLQAWSLRNESEIYKSTYDYSTKIRGTEKSGKLFTSEQYMITAKANIAEYEKEYYSVDLDSYYGRQKTSSIRISRY